MLPLDKDTNNRLNLVYPDLAVRWRRTAQSFFEAHRMPIKVSQGYRSREEQLNYFKLGRTQKPNGTWQITNPKKIVTHAMPGASMHNYGLALDSAFVGLDPFLMKMAPASAEYYWSEYGRFAESFGLVWGGRWPGMKLDRPHVELTYGLSLDEIRSLSEYDGLKSVWAKIDQIRQIEIGSEWKTHDLIFT